MGRDARRDVGGEHRERVIHSGAALLWVGTKKKVDVEDDWLNVVREGRVSVVAAASVHGTSARSSTSAAVMALAPYCMPDAT